MPDIYDMTGRNSSWLRSRIGHLTGSNFGRVMTYAKGNWRRTSSTVRDKYIMELVAERMIDGAIDHYVTDAMQHGIDHEPDAIALYEQEKRVRVQPAEFILHKSIEHFGGTPDGLVGADGGVECKCPSTIKYVSWRMSQKPPEEHVPQMAAYLCITGRRWWDLAAHDPRVKKGPKPTVWRYELPDDERQILETEAQLFLAQVDLVFRQVTETT